MEKKKVWIPKIRTILIYDQAWTWHPDNSTFPPAIAQPHSLQSLAHLKHVKTRISFHNKLISQQWGHRDITYTHDIDEALTLTAMHNLLPSFLLEAWAHRIGHRRAVIKLTRNLRISHWHIRSKLKKLRDPWERLCTLCTAPPSRKQSTPWTRNSHRMPFVLRTIRGLDRCSSFRHDDKPAIINRKIWHEILPTIKMDLHFSSGSRCCVLRQWFHPCRP